MIRQNARIAILATTLLVAIPSPVAAGQWNDRTTLTFSEPVKVPGATLPAGTYVFELVNPGSSTHVVKITDEATAEVRAVTHAVPTRRQERTEDVILLFTPMDRAGMPAIRGWFPPGRQHGHLFLYAGEEARSLAQRTKSVVLSEDVQGSSKESGTIVMIHPGGSKTGWKQDADTQRDWDAWSNARRESVTPMVVDAPRGQQTPIGEVEDHPEQYFGKTLSIDGKVDEVYGPHLFELDQPEWGQPEGDVLVFLPKDTLAAVREDDRVTVTGTLKRFSRSDVIKGARWLDVDGLMESNLDKTPVLVATRVVGGSNDRAIVLSDTTATTITPMDLPEPISDIAILTAGGLDLVGRRVGLSPIVIHSLDRDEGFFVKAGNRSLFVMARDPDGMKFRVGQAVRLEGVVLALPPRLAASLKMPAEANPVIYVYAKTVESAR